MINEIFDLAISNGLWAALFVALFFYVLKDASNREKKYQITIASLSEHLNIVKEINKKVDDISSKTKVKNVRSTKTNEKELKKENI